MKTGYSIQNMPIDHTYPEMTCSDNGEGGKGIYKDETLIAYVWYDTTETETDKMMHLHMIEVIEKGEGHGTNCISFLFEHEGNDLMFGTVKFDSYAIAYYFWLSLGAEMNIEDEADYWEMYNEDMDISFTLNRNQVIKETVLEERA